MPLKRRTQKMFDSVTERIKNQTQGGLKVNPETGIRYEEPLEEKHPGLTIGLMAAQPGTILEKVLAPSVYKGMVKSIGEGNLSEALMAGMTPVKANPYIIADLGGGYMLKPLMRGSPLEKQLSAQGTININNIKALVGKGSKVEQSIVDQVLSEQFAGQRTIDYNTFRKAVQDKLIKYKRTPSTNYEDYGMDALGVSVVNKTDQRLLDYQIDMIKRWLSEGKYSNGEVLSLDDKIRESNELKWLLFLKNNSAKPETFTFSSRGISGSNKHYDSNTLGHSRTYTTTDEPDVLHVMESQSDWAQQANKGIIKSYTPEEISDKLKDIEQRINLREAELWTMKDRAKQGLKPDGTPIQYDWERRDLADIIKRQEDAVNVQRTRYIKYDKIIHPEKYIQETYLQQNYPIRQMQENLKFAAEKGQTRMRYPTRETAAKIEGYSPIRTPPTEEEQFIQKTIEKIQLKLTSEIENIFSKLEKPKNLSAREEIDLFDSTTADVINNNPYMQRLYNTQEELRKKLIDIAKTKKLTYAPEHETVLKRYSDFPKQYGKLFKGSSVRNVTDPKGNTWYEVNVPENYLKMEWQYKQGGKLKRR